MAGLQGYGMALYKLQQEERDLRALREQQVKNQVPGDNGGLDGDVEVLGEVKNGNVGGLFDGEEVIVEQRSLSEGVDELRKESQARLGEGRSQGAKVANIIPGLIPMAVLTLAKIGLGILGIAVNTVLG